MVKRVKELPSNPKKGSVYEKVVTNPKTGKKRVIEFKATGKDGYGKWKIQGNKPYKKK